MAYSESLADRVRAALETEATLSERKMIGGLCFMLDGKLTCGVVGDELMVRVGRTRDGLTGKSMKGMVYVDAATLTDDKVLDAWVERGRRFAGSLPPKVAKSKASSTVR